MTLNEVRKIERDGVENDLTFIGFIVMENRLKQVTTSIIEDLNRANVRTIMVTGDNVLTAISVARTCGIVGGDQRIYLGELNEQQKGGVKWSDFEMTENQLEPNSLAPVNDIVDNPDADDSVE